LFFSFVFIIVLKWYCHGVDQGGSGRSERAACGGDPRKTTSGEPRHKRTPRRDDQRAAEIVHPGDKGITPTRELTEGRSPKHTEENPRL